MEKMLLLVRSARQVVSVTDDPQVTRLVGADMATCAIKDGPVSIVVNRSVTYFLKCQKEITAANS
jgi:hypothetical protein